MGWFSKKTTAEKDKEDKSKNQTKIPDYKIYIWEDVGYSVRLVKAPFDALRFVDEDKTPFIVSEENGFLELYPQDMKDRDKLNEVELRKKLEEVNKTLKSIRNKPLETYKENEPNTRDLEFEINKLEAKLRGLKFSASASYVCFDETGRVCFNFLRKGNSFFPFKWDTDTNSIHTASEPVVKKAGILLRNKENKYNTKKLVETATLILLILLIVGLLANLFFGGWLWKKYDSSNLALVELQSLEVQKICSEIVINNAKSVMEMQEKFKKSLNGTTDIYITGSVPS